MVKNKKKFILFVIVLFLILVGVIVFISLKSQNQTSLLTQPKPKLPNYIQGKLPIKIALEKEDFDFPRELPTLSLKRRSITLEDTKEFAKKLGIETPIQEFKDVNQGIKYFANTQTHTFMITPSTSIVKYGLSISDVPDVINKNLSDTAINDIAKQFLVQNGFYREDQVTAFPIEFLKRSETSEAGLQDSNKNEADVFQVQFNFINTDYKIISEGEGSNQIFIQILPDGQVFRVEMLLIDELQKSTITYAVRNYEDLVINTDEAKLISIAGEYLSPIDLKINDIESLKVDNIELAYYLEKGKEDRLTPIFLLRGPAVIKGLNQISTATLYLPALK